MGKSCCNTLITQTATNCVCLCVYVCACEPHMTQQTRQLSVLLFLPFLYSFQFFFTSSRSYVRVWYVSLFFILYKIKAKSENIIVRWCHTRTGSKGWATNFQAQNPSVFGLEMISWRFTVLEIYTDALFNLFLPRFIWLKWSRAAVGYLAVSVLRCRVTAGHSATKNTWNPHISVESGMSVFISVIKFNCMRILQQ